MGSVVALGLLDGGLEGVGGEDVAVDGDDLLAGGELGLVGGAAPADVGDDAFGADAEAEGVPDVGAAAATAAGGGHGASEDLVGLSV